ncbi:MAG: restriction endonuclease, partial [Bacteroidota bacterium]
MMDKEELLKQYASELKLFIDQTDTVSSKTFLESLPDTLKGKVFEEFIAELYRGNGWIAEVKGGRNDKGADILIRHPKEPTTVQFILQAKNHSTPITQKDTLSELNQFITDASPKYCCKQYRIIATNGFVEDAFKFQRYNLRLESWMHIETLIHNFGKTEKEEPEIGLHSHNILAYENLKTLWKTNKRVAVIQATGTGKSYIIFKILSNFFGKKKILLTPS